MDFDVWVARLGIPLASYCVSLVSAFVPFVNAEAYLVFASLVFPRGSLPGVVLCATAGQMTGKVALYFAGSGALRLPLRRHEARIEQARAVLQGRRSNAVVFLSALSGLPPFYFVSIAAGVLRTRLRGFLAWGSLGRALRFAVCVVSPQLVKAAW